MRGTILFEDLYLMVVHKPAGLATQTAKTGQADLVSELKNYLKSSSPGSAPYLGVIHRLDQPVEGLLVFAKDKKTTASLTEQLTRGILKKRYCAAVCGQPPCKSGKLVDYIRRDSDGRAQIVTGRQQDFPDAKRAVLYYEADRQLYPGEAVYLADIYIETGRFHQIRAQMAAAGMPLLGDVKYGNQVSAELGRRMGITKTALCAYRLEFVHPITGKTEFFEIEKPY